MTGINKVIWPGIKDENCLCFCKDLVENLLTTTGNFIKRRNEAEKVIAVLMKEHGKETLLKYITKLAQIEYGIRTIDESMRDHVLHATLTYLLGLYVSRQLIIDIPSPLQWKIAGLFHDVGYPLEISGNIAESFTAEINKMKNDFGISLPNIHFKIEPHSLTNLGDGINSLVLIQQCLNEWALGINARREYDEMVDSGKICHGIISALAVMYTINIFYMKYNPQREHRSICDEYNINWNYSYFENDIIPACSAIFIHNLLPECFNGIKMNRSNAPLAFLLKLSDCLQEWERPSSKNPKGFLATSFDIEVVNNQLKFYANIPLGEKKKIENEIQSTLNATDVQIY